MKGRMGGSLVVVISVLVVGECFKMSKTNSGKQCMTDCVPYSDYMFCYLGWGKGNWEKCIPGSEEALQYYTSQHKGTTQKCTSLCGKFGYDYNWCFTGEDGNWDYCSPKEAWPSSDGYCKEPCRWTTDGFQCLTRTIETPLYVAADNLGLPQKIDNYDFCSAGPYNATLFREVAGAARRLGGCRVPGLQRLSRRRRLSENVVRTVGVDALAARYEQREQSVVYTSGPIRRFVVRQAPPIAGLRDVTLTLVVRATIRAADVANFQAQGRENIPGFIRDRMRLMNCLPSDEAGHLLAASFSGPTHDYNFAPMCTLLNRGQGGLSYWFRVEGYLRDYFTTHPNGHIDWTLIVTYGDLHTNRRPTGFALRFRRYDNNVQVDDSGDCYFSNDPAGGSPT